MLKAHAQEHCHKNSLLFEQTYRGEGIVGETWLNLLGSAGNKFVTYWIHYFGDSWRGNVNWTARFASGLRS